MGNWLRPSRLPLDSIPALPCQVYGLYSIGYHLRPSNLLIPRGLPTGILIPLLTMLWNTTWAVTSLTTAGGEPAMVPARTFLTRIRAIAPLRTMGRKAVSTWQRKTPPGSISTPRLEIQCSCTKKQAHLGLGYWRRYNGSGSNNS